MTTVERKIAFEKARNPFDYDKDDFLNEEDELEHENNSMQSINGMLTPMGLIPITDNTNPYKLFNFWTLHTNFRWTTDLVNVMDNTDGVETFDVFTPFRARVAIAKCFSENEVKLAIMQNLQAKPADRSLFDED